MFGRIKKEKIELSSSEVRILMYALNDFRNDFSGDINKDFNKSIGFTINPLNLVQSALHGVLLIFDSIMYCWNLQFDKQQK